jgi:hypothetical protein
MKIFTFSEVAELLRADIISLQDLDSFLSDGLWVPLLALLPFVLHSAPALILFCLF